MISYLQTAIYLSVDTVVIHEHNPHCTFNTQSNDVKPVIVTYVDDSLALIQTP